MVPPIAVVAITLSKSDPGIRVLGTKTDARTALFRLALHILGSSLTLRCSMSRPCGGRGLSGGIVSGGVGWEGKLTRVEVVEELEEGRFAALEAGESATVAPMGGGCVAKLIMLAVQCGGADVQARVVRCIGWRGYEAESRW